jgi:hypothetical protein
MMEIGADGRHYRPGLDFDMAMNAPERVQLRQVLIEEGLLAVD